MPHFNISFENALVEKGNSERTELIKNFMRKARSGEKLTIGFLGGSITQGCNASSDPLCYAYRTFKWFEEHFPGADLTYVNAGIGATDSEYAAVRVAEDLLSAHPDFVLMEFSVNDGCNEHYTETYEGAVRQILKSKSDVALMLMSNVFYNEGQSSERIHRIVARHYGLPLVSMRTTIYDSILKGEFEKELITEDDLHPNDEGHKLVADIICSYLESINPSYDVGDEAGFVFRGDLVLPAPLTKNRYERCVKLDNRYSELIWGGDAPRVKLISIENFTPDNTPRTAVKDCFRYGYSTRRKGSYAEYEVFGSCIGILYKRTVDLPAPVAKVTVDGNEDSAVILDANFEETWGDKLELTDVFMSDAPAPHKVRLEVIESPDDCNGDFYFAGMIVSG